MKYIVRDETCNTYETNNLHYKKFLVDHDCISVIYIDKETGKQILKAWLLADNSILKWNYNFEIWEKVGYLN